MQSPVPQTGEICGILTVLCGQHEEDISVKLIGRKQGSAPPITEDTLGIAINKLCANEDRADRLIYALKVAVAQKCSPVACDTIKSVFDHEFGHILDDYLDLSNDAVIMKIYQSKTPEKLTEELCSYAWDNNSPNPIAEFIAEAWSEYQNNPKCRKLAKQVGMRIEELYTKKRGAK